MGDGFDVNVGEVRAHCRTVSTISNQVSSAVGAAGASVHGDAYGTIGQFFAAAMMLASDQAREGILKAAQSIADIHTGLTEVANLYQQVDETHAQLLSLTEGDDRR
ncbi:MAG TPA: type VII secretion target [Actinophytocola sp.]|uniref:type VII secretion target n=1 Tax=Actinophytocola sp. TaxID=1872138 RepID=UPI002DDD074F|nr:type VII secretion target [Actinophytocola sp.]HEV2781703.1 type VII secretion target [Actinophytocola sp.]